MIYLKVSEVQVGSTQGSFFTVLGTQKWVGMNYLLNTTANVVTSRLPAGSYDQIRLIVPAGGVLVTLNTTGLGLPGTPSNGLMNVSASLPSGSQTGLKIYTNFTIQPGASQKIVLHFHLVETGRLGFILTPQTLATTATGVTQLLSEVYQYHLGSIGSSNLSALGPEYAANASLNLNLSEGPIRALENATGTQNIEAGLKSLFSQYTASGYSIEVTNVSVSGTLGMASGLLTLHVYVGSVAYTLSLRDTTVFRFNGEVWQITQETLTLS